MRCYDDELLYDRISIEPDYPSILKHMLIEFNTWFNIYSDTYYMLNDPVSELDSKEFRQELIDKYNRAENKLYRLMLEIHDMLLIVWNR